MKLCKDCKWCEPDATFNTLFLNRVTYSSWRFAHCARTGTQDPITGMMRVLDTMAYCSTERSSENAERCQQEAKYWEPKE